MDEILKRDQNHVTVLAGVTNDSDKDITMLRVDPISKRLLVSATGIGGGVTSLNTLTGAVTLAAGTNISLTPVGNTITIASSGSSSPLTTKGDLYGHSTVDARIPVGSNAQVLTADSTQTLGVKWSTPAAGLTVSGSNGAVQIANTAGTALTNINGLNWDTSNSRLAIPAFAVSGDAQFVGNPRFLQQTTDGTVFFAGSSGSDHGYLTSDGAFIWNNTLKMFVPGNPTSPAGRIHSLGNYLTVGDPTSFTANLVLESLTAVTPTDSISFIYGPQDSTTGSGVENPGYSGYTNNDTVQATIFSYRTVSGFKLTSPTGFDLGTVMLASNPSGIAWSGWSANNGDGSAVDGYIIVITDSTLATVNSFDLGLATSYADQNSTGTVDYSTFTGFTSSGQMFSFDVGGTGTSPSGMPYYSVPNTYTPTDSVNNGSLFQIQHTISGSAPDGWKITQGLNQSQPGAGNTTFYQTATFSNGGDLTPQHYGILSDGSALNRQYAIQTRNTSPQEYFSTGALSADTIDPNDANYYSITYTFVVPAAGQGIRATEDINSGTYTYKDKTSGQSPFYQDALGGQFLGNSPTFTPTYRSLPGVIAENTSDDTFFVPQLRLKTTNANASLGVEMYEQNTLKAYQRHLQSGNYVFYNSSGVYDFITASSAGAAVNFKNSSGSVLAAITSAGDLSISNITMADAKNLAVGSSTGTKIATATSQKLGFWNTAPIVQPTTAVAAATFTVNIGTPVNDASTFDGYTLKQIVKALRNAGLLA